MTDPLQNVAGEIIGPATMKEVSPGIHWLRMPLPFQLDHINLWALEDGDGWTLVDTGINREEVRAIWDELFRGPLAGRPVRRIIVTHFHPDHMGLAGWLCDRHGATMLATESEWTTARRLYDDDGPEHVARAREFYHAAGFDEAQMGEVERRRNPYPKRISPLPADCRTIADGDVIDIGGRGWRVIVGSGHSPEHAGLYSPQARVLISGDQILPKITPNVSVWPQFPEMNPLALFLDSLDRFRGLDPETLVLPSHNWPFRGLTERIEQLAHHHDERLDEVVAACAEPQTAARVLKHLFRRKLDSHQLFFAIGESLAHLYYLVGEGRMSRRKGDDGVDLFQAAVR